MWITIKQAAMLLNCTERQVQLNCKNNKYKCRCIAGKGRGGKQYEIDLDSLPKIARLRYFGISEESDFTSPERPNWCSLKQWEDANRKAAIVQEYKSKDLSVDDFLAWYNEKYKPKKPLKRITLFTYQKKYFDGGLYALIDNRGGITSGVELTDEMWDYFYSLYMTQQRRGVKLCYDLTKDEFGEPFPCVSSFERKVRLIDDYTLTYYRKGPKALKDLLPSMQRDKTTINSNDVWFSDHRTVDLFVKDITGKPFRPYITVFFDARSNKVISYIVRKDNPNGVVVKECLKLGIESHGIPKEVYFDNGKDYRAKEFQKDYPYSIVHQLGIGQIYATKYHGQAKTVERFFGTMSTRFDRLFPTYCGKDNKERPEQMRISNKEIAKKAPTLDEYKIALETWIEKYNNTPNSGAFMNNQSPNTVYYDNLKVKIKVNQEALEMLFATVSKRKVHKNGISLYKNNYYNSALVPYFGKDVVVRNYQDNIDKVYIFDTEEHFICTATARVVTAYRGTSEQDYKNAQREKREVYKQVKKNAPKRNLNIYELIAKNQAEEFAINNNNDVSEVEHISPMATAAATAVKEGVNKRSDENKPSLSRVMNEYYEKQKLS